jgi:hypothetical protein
MSATDGVEGGDDALSKAQLHEVSAAVVSCCRRDSSVSVEPS